MPKHSEIGSRIKQLRRDLTQKEFAAVLKISSLTLQRYEWGERTPTGPVLAKLAEISGRSVDWILTGEETGSDRGATDKNTIMIRLKLRNSTIAELESEAKRAHMTTNDYVLKLINEGREIKKILTADDKKISKSSPRNRKNRTVK